MQEEEAAALASAKSPARRKAAHKSTKGAAAPNAPTAPHAMTMTFAVFRQVRVRAPYTCCQTPHPIRQSLAAGMLHMM